MSIKEKGKDKFTRLNFEIQHKSATQHEKPKIRPSQEQLKAVSELKAVFRERSLVTVCEEASCPNLFECFANKMATFMIMGDKCTRRCAFCDVAHGKPDPLDESEPKKVARTIAQMQLKYVVITSVDRDDLLDGGAMHFAACIKAIREENPGIKIEILVPDFKKRMGKALHALSTNLPDVFNHNLETIPRLYKSARAGSDYQHSLDLLQTFKNQFAGIPTKSGIMVGLGETMAEIFTTLKDLKSHGVDMLTVGQYLAPSAYHLPVAKYYTDAEFKEIESHAYALGFTSVASGKLVRSSYHADKQAEQYHES
jgi:lipoic acid synthetase